MTFKNAFITTARISERLKLVHAYSTAQLSMRIRNMNSLKFYRGIRIISYISSEFEAEFHASQTKIYGIATITKLQYL